MTKGEKIAIALGVAGVGCALYAYFKFDKTIKLINTTNGVVNKAIDNISRDLPVDVSEIVIRKAVDSAVEREVGKAISNIVYDITQTTHRDIARNVKSAVDETYSTIRGSVSKEVATEVANLNMDLLRDRVTEEAKKMVLNKFNGNLDQLLNNFNQNLTNVSRIYSSLADTAAKKPEVVFKMGL